MPNPIAENHFKNGVEYFNRKNLTNALIEFDRAIQKDAEHFDAWCYKGECHLNILINGGYDNASAANAFATSVRINPESPRGYKGLGLALRGAGNLEDAITAFKKLAEEFSSAEGYYYLANTFSLLGEDKKALEYANKMHQINASYSPVTLKKYQDIHNHFKRGKDFYESNPSDFIHALPEFEKVIAINPKNYEAWWYIGQCHRNIKLNDGSNDNLAALKAFEKSIEANPNYFYGHNGMAHALKELKKWKEAKEAFLRANEIAPHGANLYQLSCCYANLGETDKALKYATEMNNIKPVYDPTWHARIAKMHTMRTGAVNDIEQKNYAKALANFQELVKLNPNNPSFFSGLGHCLYLVSPANALASAEATSKAIAIDPENPNYYYNLGLALKTCNKPKQAIIAFNHACELLPTYHQSYYQQGICYSLLGEDKKALEYATTIKQKYPDYDPNWVTKIENINSLFDQAANTYEMYFKKNEAQRNIQELKIALSQFSEVTRLNPYNYKAWLQVGNCHRNIKLADNSYNFDAAQEAFAKCIQINPECAYGYSGLGSILSKKGYIKEAIVLYTKASELAPEFYQSHYYLSDLLAKTGRNNEALEYAKKMDKIAPEYAPTWLSELQEKINAISIFNAGNYQNALPLFQKYIQKHPQHMDVTWYSNKCEKRLAKR